MSPGKSRTGRPESIDRDADLTVPRQRGEWQGQRALLPVIALGGMTGAVLRHLAGSAWPTPEDGVPWVTWGVNVSGCLLIGMLMVLVTEVGGAHPLLRPFLGVGLIGGFTTFSTYTVEVNALLMDGQLALALGYLLGTALTALVAVSIGVVLARVLVRVRRRTVLARGGSG